MRAPSPSLRLAPHVRVCRIDQEVIVLDLVRGQYYGLPYVSGVEHQVGGWPATDRGTAPDVNSAAAVVQRMRSADLLSIESDGAAAPTRIDASVPPPCRSLNAEDVCHARPTWRLVASFMASALRASLSLRLRSMQAVVAAANARRTRAVGRRPSGASIAELVATYERLRPLLFTVRDRCLFDSLALHYFLGDFGIHPTWVIAVKSRPFGAHSWLQLGDVVLNDQVERVVQFKPILVV